MTDADLQRVRDFMQRYAPVADSATDLAEMTATELDLDAELDDPESDIWDLALEYFWVAEEEED